MESVRPWLCSSPKTECADSCSLEGTKRNSRKPNRRYAFESRGRLRWTEARKDVSKGINIRVSTQLRAAGATSARSVVIDLAADEIATVEKKVSDAVGGDSVGILINNAGVSYPHAKVRWHCQRVKLFKGHWLLRAYVDLAALCAVGDLQFFEELEVREIEQLVNVNFRSLLAITHAVLPGGF